MSEQPPQPKAAPWRGRPRVADAKDRFVAVRVTAAEHATLNAAAAQAGLSVGAYLRAMALGRPGPRAVRRPPLEREALARALGLLGRYGGNLNQLAHVANATGAVPLAAALAQLRREVREARDAVLVALGRGPRDGD